MTLETPKRRNGETPKGPLPTTDSPPHHDFSPLILAVASPAGRSARGIIRLSGQRAIDLLAFAMDSFEAEAGLRPVRLRLNDRSLPGLLLLAIAPRSYTGEHTAELQLPGNPALLPRVIDHLLALARGGGIDARRAEPGEFTARAYLNGRISLTQAEGVAATIAAQSDAELRAAHLLTTGRGGEFARSLADDLATALALVEAGIDFTDQEDVVAISPADLHARLTDLLDRLDRQLAAAAGAEQLQAIPWVVLRGRPNAGKSALFNALLGRERAVVSPIAGTTRDVLTEPLAIETSHGVAEVMLVDLAGLDDENDAPVDLLMQAAAHEALHRAELILHCVPAGEPATDIDAGVPRIEVRTKIDEAQRTTDHQPPAREIHTSAITGEGLAELRAVIARHLDSRAVSLAADAMALSPRHSASFGDARQCLIESLSLLADHQADRSLSHPELIASTMRAALDCLGSIAGEMTPDDILGRVFSSFCVGK